MKRWTTLLIVICMLGITIPAMGAMSISKMRQNTRFLTDRMASGRVSLRLGNFCSGLGCWSAGFRLI